jgi:glycosyltransferase involved in cell wall biosynthesis
MRLALLLPAPLETISGGYEYDRRIVGGLREAGHDVRVVELAGRHPLADAAAMASACVAWDGLGDDVLPVIDGLCLPAFAGMGDAFAARRVVGLIHHPLSRETGLSAEARAALEATEKSLFAHLSGIVVTSTATAAQLVAEFGVPAERISVVEPGTDAAPRCAGSGGATCQISAVGTLVPRKGHDELLRALAKLFDLDWHLTIAGNAERDHVHAQQLRALCEALGITQRVTFLGDLGPADMNKLWAGTDVFALATHYEGYGMAIAEALKRGIPVAVTSGGAAGALVTPQAGVVCAPGDIVTLSKSLRRLIFDIPLRAGAADAAWAIGQGLPDWTQQSRAFAAALASAAG